MSRNNNLEKIVIIDFGSQFTQLIARKVREIGVYSEIINFNKSKKIKENKYIKGIILSGGPLTITKSNSLNTPNNILKLKKPILGIVILLIATGAIFLLKSNVWEKFIVNKVNETLSSSGWTLDIGNISGHLLAKTQFSNITLTHSELDAIHLSLIHI